MFLTKLSTSCPEGAWLPCHCCRPAPSCYCPLDSHHPLLLWGDICNNLACLGLPPICNILVASTKFPDGICFLGISILRKDILPFVILNNLHVEFPCACEFYLVIISHIRLDDTRI